MELVGKNNPRVKEAVALRRNRGKKSEWFLLEGFREIQKALDAGYECPYIFCHPEVSEKETPFFEHLQRSSYTLLYCSEDILTKLSYKENYDHFVAVMRKRYISRERFLEQRKNRVPFYLVIEQVEKPGNVGSILRIADAVGVDGVILCDPILDMYNPNLIRASLGTVFTLPIWSASLHDVLHLLAEEQWHVFVTSPQAETSYFYEDYQQPLALIFGSEKDGVTASWLHSTFTKISLPMRGQADSLNLSTAVAAIAYEVVRQRQMRS